VIKIQEVLYEILEKIWNQPQSAARSLYEDLSLLEVPVATLEELKNLEEDKE